MTAGTIRARPVAVTGLGLIALVLLAAVNLGFGSFHLGLTDVLGVLVGAGDPADELVVLDLRMPRTLTGALVGGALAVAGAITQSIFRNPLASPDVAGVTAGASVGAVFAVTFGAGAAVPGAALAGGLLTALVVYLLSWDRRGHGLGLRLVLVGIGVNAALVAVATWLLTIANIGEASRAVIWLTGSLNARGWENVVPVAIASAVLVPAALAGTSTLGVLRFDDDVAKGLGLRLSTARGGLLLIAVALAAVATSAAGPIPFVALVVPQIAHRLARGARPPLAATYVLGAAVTVGADTVSRLLSDTAVLPVGLVTAALGAPFLIYLLVRAKGNHG
ncbi:FecCD family ABC transporter permease [Amycolatopsis sp. cg5]|uniref:FecCD family ABC transporter permease n=1 Tax=Amycolatopsis sp. cg5 TaxID=3238802 RepID=UPI003523E4F9